MNTMNLEWGLNGVIPADAKIAFGARAILSKGYVDFVPDRRSFKDNSDPAISQLFLMKMENVVTPWIRGKAKSIQGNDIEIHTLDLGNLHARITANGSNGYLYISAWLDA